jgi:hypothetical protein
MRLANGLFVAALLAATVFVEPANAVEAWTFDEGAVGVSDHQPGEPGQEGDGSGGAASAPRLYVYWSIGWTDAGFCRQRHLTTDPDLAAAYNYALQQQLAAANAQGGTTLCPAGTPAASASPTPDMLAQDFWDVRLLPAPKPTMSPNYAVTGKPVYLQIEGERAKHFDVPDPFGPPIAVEAMSRYVIDWGDGTVETTTSSGGPWPDGDVRHVYTTSAESRTIRVAQQWSATWQAGAQQGGLDNLQTAGVLSFTVTQVQAVRG